jgi:hypothetical protein
MQCLPFNATIETNLWADGVYPELTCMDKKTNQDEPRCQALWHLHTALEKKQFLQ